MKLILLSAFFSLALADYSIYRPIEERLRLYPEKYPMFQPLPGAPELKASRIVGGSEAYSGQFPYQVALFLNTTDGNFFCGGVILNNETVGTAAHCVENLRSVEVVAGAWNISRIETTQISYYVNASAVRSHVGYNPRTLVNDIALIRVQPGFVNNSYVSIVRLPRKAQVQTDLTGTNGTTSGWGRPTNNATRISDTLRFVTTTAISNAQCGQTFAIAASHLCFSGLRGQSSCNGDSGGPVVTNLNGNGTVVGIVSFGSSLGCDRGYPHVYTRITSFIPWIESNSSVRFPA